MAEAPDFEGQINQLKGNIETTNRVVGEKLNKMFDGNVPDLSKVKNLDEVIEQLKQEIEKTKQAEANRSRILEQLNSDDKKKLEETVEAQKKYKDSLDKLSKAQSEAEKNAKLRIASINQLVDGNIKGAISTFSNTLGKTTPLLAAFTKGIETANRMLEAQANMNRRNYLLGGNNNGGFVNPAAFRRNEQMLAGMFGLTQLSKENQTRFVNELSNNFALNTFSDSELGRATRFKGGLEGTFGALGVASSELNRLQFNAMNRYGITGEESQVNPMYSQLMRSQVNSGMAMPRFITSLNSISDITVQYGGRLETAAGLLSKFGKEVNKGTISIAQLTAISSGLAGGSVSQNAGLASQLLTTGNLPAEALKFAGSPLALSGWLRNNAENMGVQRGLERMVRNEASAAGLNSEEEKQEYFRMRYSQFGFNLSQRQYQILASGGSLTAKDIKQMTERPETEEDKFYKASEKFYQDTTGPFTNLKDIYNLLSNHWWFKTAKDVNNIEKVGDNVAAAVSKQGGNAFVAGTAGNLASGAYVNAKLLEYAAGVGLIKDLFESMGWNKNGEIKLASDSIREFASAINKNSNFIKTPGK